MGKFIGERSEKQHKPKAGMSFWQKNITEKKRKEKNNIRKPKDTISNIHMWIAHYTDTQNPESCILSLSSPKNRCSRWKKKRKKMNFCLLTKLKQSSKKKPQAFLGCVEFFFVLFFIFPFFCTHISEILRISSWKRVKKQKRRKMLPVIIARVGWRNFLLSCPLIFSD